MLVAAAVLLASAAAANISPVGVEVETADGSRRIVHVVDADATPVRVCARALDPVEKTERVCADVVADRFGARARLDVVDDGDLVYEFVVTRFDARADAPAALAGGFAVATALSVIGAVVASSVAVSYGSADVLLSGAVDPGTRDEVAVNAAALATGLWIGSAVGVVATGVAALFAVTEAGKTHE